MEKLGHAEEAARPESLRRWGLIRTPHLPTALRGRSNPQSAQRILPTPLGAAKRRLPGSYLTLREAGGHSRPAFQDLIQQPRETPESSPAWAGARSQGRGRGWRPGIPLWLPPSRGHAARPAGQSCGDAPLPTARPLPARGRPRPHSARSRSPGGVRSAGRNLRPRGRPAARACNTAPRLWAGPAPGRVASAGPSLADKGRDGRARVTVEPDGELAAPTVVLYADGAAWLLSARRGGRRVRHPRWDEAAGPGQRGSEAGRAGKCAGRGAGARAAARGGRDSYRRPRWQRRH